MKKILFVLMFIFLISSIFAMSQPEGFNGNIIVNGGGNVEGKTLRGFLNGELAGTTMIQNNQFDIVITDEEGTNEGNEVEFYIGNKKAKETFSFSKFDVITTALTFTIYGDDEIEFCGDGICNSGETCSTCSEDCGECSTSPSSGSSGSSGNNGGSGISNSATTNSNNDGNADEVSNLAVENLNEKENQKNAPITGGVIQGVTDFALSPTGIATIISGIIILVLGIAFLFSRKKKPITKEVSSE